MLNTRVFAAFIGSIEEKMEISGESQRKKKGIFLVFSTWLLQLETLVQGQFKLIEKIPPKEASRSIPGVSFRR